MRKPLMLTGGELRGCPGWWRIAVEIEEESALRTWSIVRQPDGIYREVVSVDDFACIDIGNQIIDRRTIAQCESYYSQLRLKAATSTL
jgi:hypothetical protein